MMSMKHNKLLMISSGILLLGAQSLLAEPVARGLDDFQDQAREAIAATRAQLQFQEPFSEPIPAFAPQKSAPTRRSEDMPAVENQWPLYAAQAAGCIGQMCQNYLNNPGAGQAALHQAQQWAEDAYTRYKREQKAAKEKEERARGDILWQYRDRRFG